MLADFPTLNRVGRAAAVVNHLIRGFIAGKGLRNRIKGDFAAQFPTRGRGEAGHVPIPRDRRIADGFCPRSNAVEKVADVIQGIGAGELGAQFTLNQLRITTFDTLVVSSLDP